MTVILIFSLRNFVPAPILRLRAEGFGRKVPFGWVASVKRSGTPELGLAVRVG